MAENGENVLEYKPPGPVAGAFLRSDAFVRGLMGPYGSGKSTACIIDIMRRARLQKPGTDGKRHTRWAVIRNTYPELKTTTIKTWHQWIPPHVGRWVDSGPPSHTVQEGDIDMEVIFLALDRPDDLSKLLSLELTGAWINEAREIPKVVLDGLTGRVGRYPSVLMGGCSWSGIILDTNPPDNDHWYYKLAEETKPEGFQFFRQPSGLSEQAENVAHLPPNYYKRQLAGKSEDWVKVYVHAEYGFTQDGKPVYPDYRDSLHCADVTWSPMLPLHIGIDFGLTPAAVIGQRTMLGQWIWLSEVVTEDMGALRLAALLKAHLAEHYPQARIGSVTGDPAGTQRAATDEQTVYDILRSQGISARPAPTNSPAIRRDAVASCLRRLIDGKPGLLISPNCKTLRKAMAGAYCLKRVNVSGEERYRDEPDKNRFSHVADAAQYLMLGGGEGRAFTVAAEPLMGGPIMVENSFGGFNL